MAYPVIRVRSVVRCSFASVYRGLAALGNWCGITAAYGVPSGFGANRLMYGSMNVTAKNGAPGPSATLLLVDLPKKPPTDRSILGVNC